MRVTPGLFAKYPTIEDFAAVRPEVLAEDIRSTGFFQQQIEIDCGARRKRVLGEFGGEVPRTMDEMLTIPRRGAQDGERGARYSLRNRERRGGGTRTYHVFRSGWI